MLYMFIYIYIHVPIYMYTYIYIYIHIYMFLDLMESLVAGIASADGNTPPQRESSLSTTYWSKST